MGAWVGGLGDPLHWAWFKDVQSFDWVDLHLALKSLKPDGVKNSFSIFRYLCLSKKNINLLSPIHVSNMVVRSPCRFRDVPQVAAGRFAGRTHGVALGDPTGRTVGSGKRDRQGLFSSTGTGRLGHCVKPCETM